MSNPPQSHKTSLSQSTSEKTKTEKSSKGSFFSRFRSSGSSTTKNSDNRTFTFNAPAQQDLSQAKIQNPQNLTATTSQPANKVAEIPIEVPRFLYEHTKAELEQWKARCKTLESENQELRCAALKYKSQFMNLHHELQDLTSKFSYSSSQNDILDRIANAEESSPSRFIGFGVRTENIIPDVKLLENGMIPINTEYFSDNAQKIELNYPLERRTLKSDYDEGDSSLSYSRIETSLYSSNNLEQEGLDLALKKRSVENRESGPSPTKKISPKGANAMTITTDETLAEEVKIEELSDDGEDLRISRDTECSADNFKELVDNVIAMKYTPVVNPGNSSILGDNAFRKSMKHRPSIEFVSKSSKPASMVLGSKPSEGKTTPKDLKLFEEFFVIGVERSDILAYEKKNPSVKNTFLKPKILFNYPSEPKSLQPPKTAVPEFCFPFGVEITKVEANSDDQLLEIAFSKNTAEQNQNCFVFALKSEGLHKEHVFDDEVLKDSNSSRSLYQICIKTTDYIDLGKKAKDKKTKARYYWKVTRVYCFMTHYPMVKFFMDLNVAILDTLKLERMKVFTESIAKKGFVSNPNLEEIEGEFIKGTILHKIYSLPTPRFGSTVEIEVLPSEQITFQVPEKEKAFSLEGSWACSLVFSYLPMVDLLTLLSATLLERKIVIVSKNLALLSSFLMAFYTLIKPFIYPFPMIFMPSHLMACLESPCPLLVGINQGIAFLEEERLETKLTNCVILLLEQGRTFMFSDSSEKIPEPNFKELRQNLPELYKVFNEEENTTIEDGLDYLNGKDLSLSPQKVKTKESNRLYRPNQQESNMSFKVVQAIYQTLQAQIVDHLPLEPIYLDGHKKDLDYAAIGQYVMDQNPEEGEFLKDFVTTQTFAFFIENHYSTA